MFTIIKTLNNYLILTNTIETEKQKYSMLQEHIAYIQKFMEPYLLSHFAPYFLAHEKGRYLPGEVVVTFADISTPSIQSTGSVGLNTGLTESSLSRVIMYRSASEEWQSFIQRKWRLLQKKLFFSIHHYQ